VRDVLARVPGILLVDEAYAQFSPWSALGLIGDDLPLAVSRTFSKTWSMAAARLGYLVAPSWLVAELDKVVLPYHLDAAKQIGGRLALGFIADMERRVQTIIAERERIAAALAQLSVDVWPSGANFILFRPRDLSGHAVWQALVERSILIRDCSSWPRLAECLRVTVGTPAENDEFLAALTEVLT
jgi:histidinol-phosphate aminotransferase